MKVKTYSSTSVWTDLVLTVLIVMNANAAILDLWTFWNDLLKKRRSKRLLRIHLVQGINLILVGTSSRTSGFFYTSWKPAGSNTSPLKSQLVFGSCASVKVLDTVTFKRKDHQVGLLIVRISAIVIQVANSSEISLEVSMTAANKSCVSWTGREILRKEMNW